MKRAAILCAVLLGSFASFSQVQFSTISFEEALSLSAKTGKLIFLQFESDGCEQCNDVADKALNDPELSSLLQQTFICLKINSTHADRQQLALLYNKKEDAFGSLFISSDKALIHQYPGSTTAVKIYKEHIDKALSRAGESMRVSQMEQDYQSGNRSLGFLEFLIETKEMLSLDNQQLLETYVSLLPPDSLQSIRVLTFIARMSPLINSAPSMSLRRDYPLFLKAWEQLSQLEKNRFHGRSADKSMKTAVERHDLAYAKQIASYLGGIYKRNPLVAQRMYEATLLEYYRGVHDDVSYLKYAPGYYDKYFMTIAVDSIKRIDTMNMQKKLKETSSVTDSVNANTVTRKKTFAYSPVTQVFSNSLRVAASTVYAMTDDLLLLSKAATWSAKALEFYPGQVAMNTHALILYKLGKRDEAMSWQRQAIELKSKQGFSTTKLQQELAFMETNTSGTPGK